MANLRLLTRQQNGVTYANPEDPNYQVRFKTSIGRKSISGITVDNYITEVIISDLNTVQIGTASINDALSVRIRVSGSGASRARLGKILDALAKDITKWNSEGVLAGFEPATVPTTPEA